MIDIHCHILPGIDDDDGPCNIEEVLDMARIAVSDGIHTTIATPHIRHAISSTDGIGGKVRRLNALLRLKYIPLTILPGAEANASLSATILQQYTLNKSAYVLIEFSSGTRLQAMADVIHELSLDGLRPIVAHAERLPSIQCQPFAIMDLINSGGLIQVTAGSLTGAMGVEAHICARYLIRKQAVHFLASDAHSATRRSPLLSEGVRVAASLLGEHAANRLVNDNPESIVHAQIFNG